MNILIVASTVYSPSDVSGGDRIFLELAKRWSKNNNVVIYGNHSTGAMCHAYGVGHLFKSIGEVGGILLSNRMFSYLAYTIKTVMKIHSDIEQYDRKNTIIYSSSDFWPDSIPAYYASVFHSYIWVSGFFLVAPDIFLKYGVHRGVKRFVTLFYKISQYLVIKMILSKSSLLITCSEDVIKVINIQNYLMYGGVTINKHV